MKNNTKKRKRLIPVPIYIISMVVILLVLTFGIYFGIEISNAKLDPLLKSKLNYETMPTLVEANKKNNDGYYSSSLKNLKYGYTDKLDGLKIGLSCIEYADKNEDTNGSISYYIGFQKTDDAEVKISNVRIIAAEKWTHFVSNASTISSSAYSNNKLNDSSKLNFYKGSAISISAQFPQSTMLGIKRIKHPNLYIYIEYTYASIDKEFLVEFDFNDYYIDGQSKIKA